MKIFYRTTWPISTKFDTKQLWWKKWNMYMYFWKDFLFRRFRPILMNMAQNTFGWSSSAFFFCSNGKSNSLQGKMISTFNQHACTIKLCWILICFTGERRVSWVSCFFCSCLGHHNFTLTSHNTVKCFHRTPTHMNVKR